MAEITAETAEVVFSISFNKGLDILLGRPGFFWGGDYLFITSYSSAHDRDPQSGLQQY